MVNGDKWILGEEMMEKERRRRGLERGGEGKNGEDKERGKGGNEETGRMGKMRRKRRKGRETGRAR